MKFRTEYSAKRGDIELSPEVPVVTVGSCFAENVAEKMRDCLWDARNSLGTLFNPLSIAKVVGLMQYQGELYEKDLMLFESEGIWHSWLFGTKFSSISKEELVRQIKEAVCNFRESLISAQAIIITFGTANCYFLAEGGEVVANCHKMSSAKFIRRRVSVGEIAEIWDELCDKLHSQYPDLHLLFTVSPVRHLKDGFTENARSKAILMLAVEEICKGKDYCHYFPAYEIVNDDLRDYRFYASDLVHPSAEGVEYIWEKFQETYLDEKGMEILKKGRELNQRMNHRFLVEDSPASLEFQRKTKKMLLEFKAAYPKMLHDEKILSKE